MPERQTRKIKMSDEVDPYTHDHYPRKFQVILGQQKHNARQIIRHAATIGGHFQNMYRQPLTDTQIREIKRKTGYVSHQGEMMTKSRAGQLRKYAARELLHRQNKPFVGGTTFIPGKTYQLDFHFEIPDHGIVPNTDSFVFVRYTADGMEFRDPNGLLTFFGRHNRVMATADNYETGRVRPCTASDFRQGHIENPRFPRCVHYIPANEMGNLTPVAHHHHAAPTPSAHETPAAHNYNSNNNANVRVARILFESSAATPRQSSSGSRIGRVFGRMRRSRRS